MASVLQLDIDSQDLTPLILAFLCLYVLFEKLIFIVGNIRKIMYITYTKMYK